MDPVSMEYQYRHSIEKIASSFIQIILALVLFFWSFYYLNMKMPELQKTTQAYLLKATGWAMEDPKDILYTAMPLVGGVDFKEDNLLEVITYRPLSFFVKAYGANIKNPKILLFSQLPLLDSALKAASIEETARKLSEGQNGQNEQVPVTSSKECLVGIYNTHTGETYIPNDGKERLEGKKGGVVDVAAALQGALENKYGIKVARSDQVHDQKYRSAYLKSEKTARKLLAENPAIQVLLDVHRDCGKPRQGSVIIVDGREAATVLIVVGSDAHAYFPDWKNNLAFAKVINEKMEQMYPGLSQGIRINEGRYNQFLHPHALLLEFGNSNNSKEEAIFSAQLFADVLAEILLRDVS